MAANYYELLGVARDATDRDIRQAYRKLARQYHPDVNPGDPGAEEKFKEINEAHGVLSDEEKRRKYDKYGDRWTQADEIEQAEARSRNRGRGGYHFYTADDLGGPGGMNFDLGGLDIDELFDRSFGNFGTGRPSPRQAPAEYQVDITLAEAAEGATRTVGLPDGRRLEVTIPAGVDTGSGSTYPPAGATATFTWPSP